MAGRNRRGRAAAAALAALSLLLIGGCAALQHGVVNHAGPVAAQEWHLYLTLAVVLIFVAGPVLLLVPIIAYHYRISNKGDSFDPDWGFSWPLEGLIWLPPTGIVIGLSILLWNATHRLDPYRPLPSAQAPIEVQVVALDWKWLFIYPQEGVASVNQLSIPVGRPVHLTLTSGTVMQSLLIPQLAGQIYAMAGMRTQLHLAASRAGVFRGENTQFNGDGFQEQKFDVIALPPAEYRNWLARVHAAKRPLDARAVGIVTGRSVARHPVFFSQVPAGLFEHLMMASTQEHRK